jgi:hypothetical protein
MYTRLNEQLNKNEQKQNLTFFYVLRNNHHKEGCKEKTENRKHFKPKQNKNLRKLKKQRSIWINVQIKIERKQVKKMDAKTFPWPFQELLQKFSPEPD